MNDSIESYILQSSLDLAKHRQGPLIEIVREVESAWETLQEVRAQRGRVTFGSQAVAQLAAAAMSAVNFSARFIRSKDTTLDTKTGLMWSDTLGDSSLDFAGAGKAIAACRAGGFDDWRKPTVEELQTILDRTRHNPAIDTNAFPGTKSGWYWTDSECVWSDKQTDGRASYFWIVGFYDGGVHCNHRDSYAFARAVRGGGAPASQ